MFEKLDEVRTWAKVIAASPCIGQQYGPHTDRRRIRKIMQVTSPPKGNASVLATACELTRKNSHLSKVGRRRSFYCDTQQHALDRW